MTRTAISLGVRNEQTLPADPRIDALTDQVNALRALVQAYETLFLSFSVPKREIAQAVTTALKTQRLTVAQQRIVHDLLQSV